MSTIAIDIFEKLMALGPEQAVADRRAFKRVGLLVDLASDLGRDEGTARAIEWCDELSKRKLTEQQAALLEYFRANAWATRERASRVDDESVWRWNQPELQRQVLHLRRAVQSPGFDKLPLIRRCQILTNLGNQLNTVGRFVEANAIWTRALSINPRFGVALGNRGYGLMEYSIQRDDFENKTLKVLKLARAGLIYLSLGMNREEQRRNQRPSKSMPMDLPTFKDQWKR